MLASPFRGLDHPLHPAARRGWGTLPQLPRTVHLPPRSFRPSVSFGQRSRIPWRTRQPLHVVGFVPVTDARSSKRHTELNSRKVYLTNFWYAVGFSEKVEKAAIQRVKILDMHVALWRGASGEVHCVTDECPLTGQRLSDGAAHSTTLTDGSMLACITTADGSATYDASTGTLVAGGAAEPPAGAADSRLEVWDCCEKGGFVWLFFGDKDMDMSLRPAIPWVPELNKPGWKGVHGEVTIKGNHWMVMENVIDMAHVPYVHKGTVGDHAAFVDIVIKETPTSLNFAFPIENLRPAGEKAAMTVDVRATACMPSTSFIRFTFPFDLRLVTINSVVPVDANTTTIRFCQMRNFARLPIVDPLIRQGMVNILGEDKVIIEMLRPEDVSVEVSLAADAPQMAFRRMRERYIAQGHYVDIGDRALHTVQKQASLSS